MTGIQNIFGIRHHGPGSARSLRQALVALRPDVVLVEGPPDANALIPLVVNAAMQPPVAILIYPPEQVRLAVYYPFAHFSPEWQALAYALEQQIAVRFIDLPQAHRMAMPPAPPPAAASESPVESDTAELIDPRHDPIGALASAAGYSDGERWWEHIVEQRRDSTGLFEAILEAMTELRRHASPDPDPLEALREAWMRQAIRQARAEGHQRIAVVCGAWHSPALVDLSDTQADERLLRKLPSINVAATWVPWTYSRLAARSGYGAGVESPGWYAHLWEMETTGKNPTDTVVTWMARVARLLRTNDLDASSAHVIEAVRLAESLAALRDLALPGLPELSESARAVFCSASDMPMRLIHEQLIVGSTLGEVPPETPLAPLQADLARLQKRLRLQVSADWKEYDLDLRKPNDLERSHLLHRLALLKIAWGRLQPGGGKGTFREVWRLVWQPELAVELIEAGIWGATIQDAASSYTINTAQHASNLPELTALIDHALLADLPEAVAALIQHIEQQAALASDIAHLMQALPPLVQILRYGNVRNTDASAVGHVVAGLVTRIAIGLPNAAVGLNDEAALAMYQLVVAVDRAITLLQRADLQAEWNTALARIARMANVHGLLAGRAVRIQLDSGMLNTEEAARLLHLALSTASDPAQAAAWIEGLIRESGTLLVHDEQLFGIIDAWLLGLPADGFIPILPLLRRAFASFSMPERRAIGERARYGGIRRTTSLDQQEQLDHQQAEAALSTTLLLLGLAQPQ